MSNFYLETQIDWVKKLLNDSVDVAHRVFEKQGQKLAFVFVKSIINQDLLSSAVYFPLQTFSEKLSIENIKDSILKVVEVKIIPKEQIEDEILNGRVIVFADFDQRILSVDLFKIPTRTPSEPPTSPVLQGPREGFVEDFQTNITLIRRRIKSSKLVLDTIEVGNLTNTKVTVCHLKGVAREDIVKKVTEKIKKINIDGIVDSFYVLSFLQEHPSSLFKQIGNSEKPDVICSKLLEGKVAIIVDGSPIVLSVPFVFL